MKALVATRYGGPGVVVWRDWPEPAAGPGQVVVRMVAASVVAPDVRLRGGDFPRGFGVMARAAFGLRRLRHPVLGCEGAGVVIAAGPGVTRFAAGDEVIVHPSVGFGHGTHAERLAIAADGAVIEKPPTLTWAEAAAFCHGGLTALFYLRDRMALRPGQRLLVAGAAGSVGHAAVQVGRAMGAEVTAGADARHHARLAGLGVGTLDLRAGVRDERFDKVLDCTGTLHPRDGARLLRPGGRLGLIAADLPDMLGAALRRDVVTGSFTGQRAGMEWLADLTWRGGYRPAVAAVIPAAEGARAHAAAMARGRFGSVVLSFDAACGITGA
jgi:NADPH:quinone reductase-like Zn-dependent oxidoreductase